MSQTSVSSPRTQSLLWQCPPEGAVTSDRHSIVYSRIDHDRESLATPKPPLHHRFRRVIPSLPSGWRGGLLLNICTAMLVLIVNVSFLAWATQTAPPDISAYPMRCENAAKLSTLSHAMVNLLSAVLLSASNYTMQVLSSPKRAEVDRAHRQGTSLTIGIQSTKNLGSIGLYRATLWLLLAVSSLPVHLLYNSVLFRVTGANAYMVAVTSPDFVEGAPFALNLTNRLDTSYSEPLFSTGHRTYTGFWANPSEFLVQEELPIYDASGHSVLSTLQKKAQRNQLIELTKEECIHTYLPENQTQYRNLIAVSDSVRSNSSVVWIYHSSPTGNTNSSWICTHGSLTGTNNVDSLHTFLGIPQELSKPNPCDQQKTLEKASDWSLGLYSVRNRSEYSYDQIWDLGSHPISRCLAEPVTSPCGIKYHRNIHIIVIAANVAKVLVMVATMLQYKRPALITVGDALASFLRTPDPTTHGLCLGQKKDFEQCARSTQPKMYLIAEEELHRSSGASRSQWVATSAMYALSGLAATILFPLVCDPQGARDWSFGSSVQPNSLKLGRGMGASSLIIVANIPQLILSMDYMLFNRLFTCMVGSKEWSLFAHQRKGLRTSTPKGAQRSTYWLQLPLKFSIPLMAVSAFLHYLASQSLYFGSVQHYAYHDVDGERHVLNDYTGLGYSQTAIHVLMISLLLTMTAAVMWGRRRNKLGMPPSEFNSAVISAACHPPTEEDDVHLKPVQWGEVPKLEDGSGIGHCSFSSEEVTMPVVGKEYA